jgi:type IV pilus assembly protein PilN
MIRINLLPYWEFKKQTKSRRVMVIFVTACIVFAVLLVSFHTYMVMRLGRIEKETAAARARLEELTKMTAGLEQYKMDMDTFRKKIAVIEKLEKGRTKSAGVMELFSKENMKGQMWLTFLSRNEGSLRVEGMAMNNAVVADYMKKLEKTGAFASVDLLSAKQAALSGVKLMNFMISCRFLEE